MHRVLRRNNLWELRPCIDTYIVVAYNEGIDDNNCWISVVTFSLRLSTMVWEQSGEILLRPCEFIDLLQCGRDLLLEISQTLKIKHENIELSSLGNLNDSPEKDASNVHWFKDIFSGNEWKIRLSMYIWNNLIPYESTDFHIKLFTGKNTLWWKHSQITISPRIFEEMCTNDKLRDSLGQVKLAQSHSSSL